MGILAALLLGILYTSVRIYPPFAFITYHNTQAKIMLIRKLIIPSVIILACVLLGQIQNRKLHMKTLIVLSVTLIANIIIGIVIEKFNTTHAVYFLSGINLNLIPLCFVLLVNDFVKLKLPNVILYISLILTAIFYVVFIVMLFFGSYVLVFGFMYLILPIAVMSNIVVLVNLRKKILKVKTISAMYAVNSVFTLYNMIWHWGNVVATVLGGMTAVGIAVSIGLIIFDLKKYKKGLAICNKM
jgi:hypothetical protein